MNSRLDRVVLDGESPNNLSPYIEADREQAVADLAAANHFAPLIGTDQPGPYALHLSIQEGRLIFDIRNTDGGRLTAIGLALGPFRRLVKDYQLLVDSHIKAVEEGREQIEEIEKGPVLDAAIIGAAQKVEHYEIATYGTLAALAKQLGQQDAMKLLLETLEEEKATDKKLTILAEQKVSAEAAGKR